MATGLYHPLVCRRSVAWHRARRSVSMSGSTSRACSRRARKRRRRAAGQGRRQRRRRPSRIASVKVGDELRIDRPLGRKQTDHGARPGRPPHRQGRGAAALRGPHAEADGRGVEMRRLERIYRAAIAPPPAARSRRAPDAARPEAAVAAQRDTGRRSAYTGGSSCVAPSRPRPRRRGAAGVRAAHAVDLRHRLAVVRRGRATGRSSRTDADAARACSAAPRLRRWRWPGWWRTSRSPPGRCRCTRSRCHDAAKGFTVALPTRDQVRAARHACSRRSRRSSPRSCASSQWHDAPAWWHQGEAFGKADPVLGYDAAFYVFTLPVARAVRGRWRWRWSSWRWPAPARCISLGGQVALTPFGLRLDERARRHLASAGGRCCSWCSRSAPGSTGRSIV